ncbi:HNH endonuclease [Rhizobium mongolense]
MKKTLGQVRRRGPFISTDGFGDGPIPEGHVLKCLDGDKTNCDPSNWELISREVLPHLSGRFGFAYDQAEPEVKPAMMAVAKLKHAVKQARSKVRSG